MSPRVFRLAHRNIMKTQKILEIFRPFVKISVVMMFFEAIALKSTRQKVALFMQLVFRHDPRGWCHRQIRRCWNGASKLENNVGKHEAVNASSDAVESIMITIENTQPELLMNEHFMNKSILSIRHNGLVNLFFPRPLVLKKGIRQNCQSFGQSWPTNACKCCYLSCSF